MLNTCFIWVNLLMLCIMYCVNSPQPINDPDWLSLPSYELISSAMYWHHHKMKNHLMLTSLRHSEDKLAPNNNIRLFKAKWKWISDCGHHCCFPSITGVISAKCIFLKCIKDNLIVYIKIFAKCVWFLFLKWSCSVVSDSLRPHRL